MGNQPSQAERLLSACSGGSIAELQKIINGLPASGPQRKLVLEATDKEGRTGLIIAAVRNHTDVAKLLLINHANVDYMSKGSARGGTALHEAAARRHEEMVDLLMQYGANPFLANGHGETPVELAVLSGSSRIVRTFEQRALFSGDVEFQWTAFMGMSNEFKSRHVVVMDHYPCPKPNAPAQPVRRQMWIHSNRDNIMPKCRVWLDGATAIRCTGGGGGECILRLAPSHVQPVGNMFTRFAHGYCLFLRPGKSARRANATGSAPREQWERLLQLCNVTDAVTVPSLAPFLKGASGSAMPAGALPPQGSSGGGGFGNGVAAAAPPPRSVASLPTQRTGGSASPVVAAPPPRSYPDLGPGGVLRIPPVPGGPAAEPFPWGGPPSNATPRAAPASPHHYMAGSAAQTPVSHRPTASMSGIDAETAAPGESDLEFAARLAAQFSSGGGHGGGAVDPVAFGLAAAALSSPVPRYSPAAVTVPRVDSEFAPSAPPAALLVAAAARPAAAAGAPPPDSEDACVICLEGRREAGFLHSGTLHRCVCNECSREFSARRRSGAAVQCPLCRQLVEQVITVF